MAKARCSVAIAAHAHVVGGQRIVGFKHSIPGVQDRAAGLVGGPEQVHVREAVVSLPCNQHLAQEFDTVGALQPLLQPHRHTGTGVHDQPTLLGKHPGVLRLFGFDAPVAAVELVKIIFENDCAWLPEARGGSARVRHARNL